MHVHTNCNIPALKINQPILCIFYIVNYKMILIAHKHLKYYVYFLIKQPVCWFSEEYDTVKSDTPVLLSYWGVTYVHEFKWLWTFLVEELSWSDICLRTCNYNNNAVYNYRHFSKFSLLLWLLVHDVSTSTWVCCIVRLLTAKL